MVGGGGMARRHMNAVSLTAQIVMVRFDFALGGIMQIRRGMGRGGKEKRREEKWAKHARLA